MGRQAVGLRRDFDGKALRRLARASKDASQARRLLALAAVYDGSSRSEAARIGDVSLQTVRDWALRFNEQGPDGLINGKKRTFRALSASGRLICAGFYEHRQCLQTKCANATLWSGVQKTLGRLGDRFFCENLLGR